MHGARNNANEEIIIDGLKNTYVQLLVICFYLNNLTIRQCASMHYC